MEKIKAFTTNLLHTIKHHHKFCLFVHHHPDCDALGSAYAMKKFIELNFKHKDVRIAGITNDNINYLPKFFHEQNYVQVDEKFAKNSVAIVFDVANYERILQKTYFNKENSFRIDHHIFVEAICKNELVDTFASSTCELVGWIIKESKLKLNDEIGTSLYFGILTDTIRFLTSNVNPNTYAIVSFLLQQTNIKRQNVHDQLYLKTLSELKLDRKFFKLIKFKNGYAYLKFSKHLSKKYDHNILKTKLYLMSNIKQVKIYALLYYDHIAKFYRCSLRSRNYDVNKIALKFSGGGHLYASGCKIQNEKEFKLLEKEIKQALKK